MSIHIGNIGLENFIRISDRCQSNCNLILNESKTKTYVEKYYEHYITAVCIQAEWNRQNKISGD